MITTSNEVEAKFTDILNSHGIEYTAKHRPSSALKLPKPSLADVMHSLLVDSMGDFSSFSNWCNDYGYGSDSISAQDTFNACRDTKLSLEGLFTTESLAMMNELLEDH
jgi:hypothetical protein